MGEEQLDNSENEFLENKKAKIMKKRQENISKQLRKKNILNQRGEIKINIQIMCNIKKNIPQIYEYFLCEKKKREANYEKIELIKTKLEFKLEIIKKKIELQNIRKWQSKKLNISISKKKSIF